MNLELLKKLAETEDPCVTLMLPVSALADLRPQIKNAVREVKKALESSGSDTNALLGPIEAFGSEGVPPSQRHAGTWVFLRSPSLFESFFSPGLLHPLTTTGKKFPFLRILPLLDHEDEFYLLALSQKHTRLLRCTIHDSAPVDLPDGTPLSLAEAMQTRQPDHVLDNRSSAGPSVGSMKGVMFGTASDRDAKEEYLLHYFQEIDKAITRLLRESGQPLIVAAVERELALYARVNTYPDLVEPGVSGAPDGLKGGEMHGRALALLQSRIAPPVRKALDQFDKLVGSGHASTEGQEVVDAAAGGRVSHLFLQESAEFKSYVESEERDLLNEAIIQVIRSGGVVSVMKNENMPGGAQICALFRYPAPKPAGAANAAASVEGA